MAGFARQAISEYEVTTRCMGRLWKLTNQMDLSDWSGAMDCRSPGTGYNYRSLSVFLWAGSAVS